MPRLLLVLLLLALLPAGADGRPRAHASVVGGTPATIEQHPYAAALVTRGQSAGAGQFCGATVIAPDAVVTAAHCVEDVPPFDVVVGRTELDDAGSGARVAIAQIIAHPRWSFARGTFDVAVVRLAEPVGAPPLALAGPATAPRPGDQLKVAGWGLIAENPDTSPDQLQEAPLGVRSDDRCAEAYGAIYRRSVQLCAGSPRGGAPDACRGDSGGPLVGTDRLVGIVSFGGARCASRAPAVYTRVTAVRDFIADAASRPVDPVAPEPVSGRTRARVAEVACDGGRLCRVDARILGPSRSVAYVVVRIRRSSTGCVRARRCRAIDRYHVARRLPDGRFRARIDLPYGLLRVAVYPVDERGEKVGTPSGIAVTVVPG